MALLALAYPVRRAGHFALFCAHLNSLRCGCKSNTRDEPRRTLPCLEIGAKDMIEMPAAPTPSPPPEASIGASIGGRGGVVCDGCFKERGDFGHNTHFVKKLVGHQGNKRPYLPQRNEHSHQLRNLLQAPRALGETIRGFDRKQGHRRRPAVLGSATGGVAQVSRNSFSLLDRLACEAEADCIAASISI
jgi:hypothetical protein